MLITINCDEYTIKYDITENILEGQPFYGITVTCDEKTAEINNMYFTREEAILRCKWLAQNEVFPENLHDVMSDITDMAVK